LDHARDEFEAAGIQLVLIGQATSRHAAHFRRRQGIELPVLADERRESYEAIGAKMAKVTELFGPSVVAKGLLTIARTGKLQGRTIGHPAQLGAAAVFRPGGAIAWSHVAQDASDNAAPEEILAAARSG
jgi:hypothetical protein